ncbi:hypothetical protein L210DRAFT_3223849 [Boletus edulis BED1]|uniref:Uncharacterized protein n=1 Tax=Boletus edulis BED1 TaxID=1328754 RepID=A0AAD4G8G1_BOLED|nr:hypothetical protein L210DRAFT_3223849 [Boletus edulis BED1]
MLSRHRDVIRLLQRFPNRTYPVCRVYVTVRVPVPLGLIHLPPPYRLTVSTLIFRSGHIPNTLSLSYTKFEIETRTSVFSICPRSPESKATAENVICTVSIEFAAFLDLYALRSSELVRSFVPCFVHGPGSLNSRKRGWVLRAVCSGENDRSSVSPLALPVTFSFTRILGVCQHGSRHTKYWRRRGTGMITSALRPRPLASNPSLHSHHCSTWIMSSRACMDLKIGAE